MTRKELYALVKGLGAEAAIKKKFGDNYTRISNADLEAFLTNLTKKKKSPAQEENNSRALIRLVSTLQVNKVLTAAEAKEVVELL